MRDRKERTMKRILTMRKGGMVLRADARDCWVEKGSIVTWVSLETYDGFEGCDGHLAHRDYFSGPEGDRFLTEREEAAAWAMLAEARPFIDFWMAVAWAQVGQGIDPRIGTLMRDGEEVSYAVIGGEVVEGDIALLTEALRTADVAEDRKG
jgi:hypothetical protein